MSRLEDAIALFLSQNHPIMPVANTQVPMPPRHNGQMLLCVEGKKIGSLPAAQTMLGCFFERASLGVVGGTHLDNRLFLNGSRAREEIILDVVSNAAKIECKSRRAEKECLITDRQIGKHVDYQNEDPLVPISYMIWTHGVPNIRSYCDGEDALYQQCASTVRTVTTLPLRIILRAYDVGCANQTQPNKLITRYQSHKNSIHSTRLTPELFVSLLENPSKTLEDLDLDPDEFEIKKHQLPVISVGDYKITRKNEKNSGIPVVWITDKIAPHVKLHFSADPTDRYSKRRGLNQDDHSSIEENLVYVPADDGVAPF